MKIIQYTPSLKILNTAQLPKGTGAKYLVCEQENTMKTRRCKKCKSEKLSMVEYWKNHTITWFYGDSQDEGYLEPGEPYKVEMRCDQCGHHWRVRGCCQVSSKMFQNETSP